MKIWLKILLEPDLAGFAKNRRMPDLLELGPRLVHA